MAHTTYIKNENNLGTIRDRTGFDFSFSIMKRVGEEDSWLIQSTEKMSNFGTSRNRMGFDLAIHNMGT